MVPGPSDDSLRRAGLMRYAEPENTNVPESCKAKATYDEATAKYTIPILSKECVKAITGENESHILTPADVSRLATWWARNADDRSAGQWQLVQGAALSFVGDPISTLTGGGAVIDRQKLPTEDVSNQIDRAVRFAFDPGTWLAIGGLLIGGGMIVYGGMRYLRGGQ